MSQKEKWNKKIAIFQYITLIIGTLTSIGYPWYCMFSGLWVDEFWLGAFGIFAIFFLLSTPIGILIGMLSTIAFVFNKDKKCSQI